MTRFVLAVVAAGLYVGCAPPDRQKAWANPPRVTEGCYAVIGIDDLVVDIHDLVLPRMIRLQTAGEASDGYVYGYVIYPVGLPFNYPSYTGTGTVLGRDSMVLKTPGAVFRARLSEDGQLDSGIVVDDLADGEPLFTGPIRFELQECPS